MHAPRLSVHAYGGRRFASPPYSGLLPCPRAWILKAGGPVDVTNTDGFTPLMMAATVEVVESARLLLTAGADPLLMDKGGAPGRSSTRKTSRSAVDYAYTKKNPEMQALLSVAAQQKVEAENTRKLGVWIERNGKRMALGSELLLERSPFKLAFEITGDKKIIVNTWSGDENLRKALDGRIHDTPFGSPFTSAAESEKPDQTLFIGEDTRQAWMVSDDGVQRFDGIGQREDVLHATRDVRFLHRIDGGERVGVEQWTGEDLFMLFGLSTPAGEYRNAVTNLQHVRIRFKGGNEEWK